jgi:hypothetical protein
MARFGLNFLTFFVSLTIGISFGAVRLDFSSERDLRRDQLPAESPEKYDFFAGHKQIESTSPEQNSVRIDPSEVRKTFCSDPAIRPIWKLIRRDPEVREALEYVWSPFGDSDCKAMFELKYVDLDRDGRAEILVRGGGTALCGAVGNCDFWVIKRERTGLRLLLHADDYIDATDMGKQVLKTRTNGHADLLLKGHFSASETSYSTYKYNRRRYVESRCRYHVPNYNDPKYDNENPTWHFISCREFYRGLKN